MINWQHELTEKEKGSLLYSDDLAPLTPEKRNWGTWQLAALWVGMAVCIPTWMLASQIVTSGLSWQAALIIIGLANAVITIPMVLNGHAGVKYGLPFPVIGRSAFGVFGIHLPAMVRAMVACGWFGIQTWVGGLAIGAIIATFWGVPYQYGINTFNIIGFVIFWLISMYFVVSGTNSIRWLEEISAPILVLIGLLLIIWGANAGGGFSLVLEQTEQLKQNSIRWENKANGPEIIVQPLKTADGTTFKANEFALADSKENLATASWQTIGSPAFWPAEKPVWVQVRHKGDDVYYSSAVQLEKPEEPGNNGPKTWTYILWFTAMVGFWATMAISISDITRLAKSQKAQIAGQFIGLPGTMMLFSFIGVFVTCAALIVFPDVLIAEDAPWDPVSVLARFQTPWVVIVAQIMMLIATLSTNIAANVIAPATAFSNMLPKWISFKTGGIITGFMGILICPWWLIDEISGILLFVSGMLGPVLGILLTDYFIIRKTQLNIPALYQTDGEYAYNALGINPAALMALIAGTFLALLGKWIPGLAHLYDLSWFTGCFVSAIVYCILFPIFKKQKTENRI